MKSTKVAEKVYLDVLQHPTKFQAKLLTGKFYLCGKQRNLPSGRVIFWVYFWP